MHLFGFLVTVVAVFTTCSAQSASGNASLAPVVDFSQIPTCGLVCLATTAPKSGCRLSDFGCICGSQQMTDMTTRCALANCTIPDAFKLARIQADICQYSHESRTEEARSIVLAFAIMTKVVIPTRLGLRLLTQGSLGWDDWIILAAFCSDTTAFYAAMRVLDNGLGKHIWDIDPARLPDFLTWFYVVLAAYVLSNGLIKLSVLAFYLRIFTVSERFRVLCWINIVFCASLMITFLFVTIFQCVPISNSFKIAPTNGFCINYNAATWSHSAINVFQDILVIVLPIMEVVALQMSLRKKIGVILIFVLGGFVVVASAVRMFFIPGFGRTSDPTWTNTSTFVWSAIELGVGLICASIPGIYSGLRHAWPGFRNFTRRHISQRSSKPSQESQDSHKKQNSLSEIPHHVKYHRASSDLPLTTFNDKSYGHNEVEVTSNQNAPVRYEVANSSRVVNVNKAVPPLPREQNGIEASTSITIIRGPRSSTFD